MKPANKPWSEAALDALMREVADDVAGRAQAVRERLAHDPVERGRMLVLIRDLGFTLDENQTLIRLS